jgi:hypothetical protein
MRLSYWRAAAWAFAGLALTTAIGARELNRPAHRAIAMRAMAAAGDYWDSVTGSVGGEANFLPLSDEQRGHIFDGIMRLRNAPVARVQPSAAALPRSVALQDLPASVTADIPMVQGYKFVKLDDRILLVHPADRTVVAVMPRYKTVLD